MELLLKRVIVLAVAISVAVPSIYFSVTYYHGSQYEKNPLSYIPSTASAVGRVDAHPGVFYFFVENRSLGLVVPISVFAIPQILNISGDDQNLTRNATLTYYTEYRSVSIFELDGINAWSVISGYISNDTVLSEFNSSIARIGENLSSITFYIASPQNSFSMISDITTLEYSIDSYIDRTSFSLHSAVQFNDAYNISFYVFPPSGTAVNHASVNLTWNYTEMWVSFNNLNATTLLTLTSYASAHGFSVIVQSNSVELVTHSGFTRLLELISLDKSLSNQLGRLSI